jgi:hypothetical protein
VEFGVGYGAQGGNRHAKSMPMHTINGNHDQNNKLPLHLQITVHGRYKTVFVFLLASQILSVMLRNDIVPVVCFMISFSFNAIYSPTLDN